MTYKSILSGGNGGHIYQLISIANELKNTLS
jgi:hypothetical protein